MAVTVSNSFLQALKRSNLLSSRQYAQVRAAAAKAGLNDNPEELATALVRRSLLTAWQAKQLMAGQKAFYLGQYKLLDRLGKGGMGSVFRALDTTAGRLVALKVVSQERLAKPAALKRFQREIYATSQLKHPNVIAALDSGQVGNTHFLVMEYCEGQDLNRLVKQRGKLPIDLACEFVRQAAVGLEHAHSRGMVHRDIKPANILITQHPHTEEWVVKVLDLGLARFVSEEFGDADLTQTGQILGTPDYIAPEQGKNTRNADIRADIFSLGCTLFRALTDQLPFPGDNPVEKLISRYTSDAPPIRTLRPDIPPPLEQIVAKMLSREPEDRFQTPAEVAAALAPFSLSASPAATQSSAPPIARPVAVRPGAMLVQSAEAGMEVPDDDGSNTQEFLQLLAQQSDKSTATDAGETMADVAQGMAAARQAEVWSESWQDTLLRNWQTVSIASAALLLLLIVGAIAMRQSSRTVISIDWPHDQREGAVLIVDDQTYLPTNSQTQTIRKGMGEHRVRIERKDHKPIVLSKELGWGAIWNVPLKWKLTNEATRKKQIAEYQQVAGSFLSVPAAENRAFLVLALVRDLEKFRDRWLYHEESEEARRLVARLNSHFALYVKPPTKVEPKPPRIDPQPKIPLIPIPPVQSIALDALQPDQLPPLASKLYQGVPLVGVFGDLSFKHNSRISSLAYSPDGSLLASAAEDGIKIWDAKTRAERFSLPGSKNLYRMAFAPDGRYLAVLGYSVAGNPLGMTVWDLKTRQKQPLRAANIVGTLYLTFRAAGDSYHLVSSHSDGTIRLWDLQTGELAHTLAAHPFAAMVVEVSPAGNLMATLGADGLKIWEFDKDRPKTEPRKVLESYEGDPRRQSMAFSAWGLSFNADGTRLASVGQDRQAKIWDLTQDQFFSKLPSRSFVRVQKLLFSPVGNLLVVCARSNPPITIWDMDQGKLVRELSLATSYSGVAFSMPRGDLLAIADGARINLVEPKTGEERFRALGHRSAIQAMHFDTDGSQLKSVSADGQLITWNCRTGTPITKVNASQTKLLTARFSPSGQKLVATGGSGRNMIQVDFAQPQPRPVALPFPGNYGMFDVSPGGAHLASLIPQGNRTSYGIGLRRLDTGVVEKMFGTGVRQLGTIAFSPAGDRLATFIRNGNNRQIFVWDAATAQVLVQIPVSGIQVTTVRFTRDSRQLIATYHGGTVEMYDLTLRKRIWSTPSDNLGPVISTSLHPRYPRLLATLDNVNRVRLRDMRNGKLLQEFLVKDVTNPRYYLCSNQLLTFGPQGRHLAVAQPSGTILILRPDLKKILPAIAR